VRYHELADKILDALWHEPHTRTQLADKLGAPYTSVYDVLRSLESKGEVDSTLVKTGGPGRPYRYWMRVLEGD